MLLVGTAYYELGKREATSENLERAVTTFQKSLDELMYTERPHEWASLQNNLGLALMELSSRGGELEIIERAGNALRASIKVWTQDVSPAHWALAHLNMGCLEMLHHERRSFLLSRDLTHIDKAEKLFRAAFQVFVETDHQFYITKATEYLDEIQSLRESMR